jgi:hypothetical protein
MVTEIDKLHRQVQVEVSRITFDVVILCDSRSVKTKVA